jgi:predicted transcriptional regulator
VGKKPKKQTAIRINEQHFAALTEIATREGESVSEIIRRAITEFLQRQPMRKP